MVLVAAGCASDGAGPPLTVDEYAAAMCSLETGLDDAPPALTWGESADALAESLDALRSLSPPPEMSEYHDTTVWMVSLLFDHVADQPDDRAFNPFDLDLLGLALVVAIPVAEAERSVPAAAVAALEAHGCDTDDWVNDWDERLDSAAPMSQLV